MVPIRQRRGRRRNREAKVGGDHGKHQNKRWSQHAAPFIFDSIYQIITWVGIALSITAMSYFLSKDNLRGVLWSGIALGVFIMLMLGMLADRHFFHGKTQSRPLPIARDLGPLIVVASIAGEPLEPAVGQTFHIIVKFINRGHSPAKKVRANVVTEPVRIGESPNFVYSKDPTIRIGTMAPDVEHQATLRPVTSRSTGESRPLTPELFDEIRTGGTRIFVHGRIEYEDAEQSKHWTTFCYFLIVPFNGHFGLWTEETNQTDD